MKTGLVKFPNQIISNLTEGYNVKSFEIQTDRNNKRVYRYSDISNVDFYTGE